jgi:hypothetical protein
MGPIPESREAYCSVAAGGPDEKDDNLIDCHLFGTFSAFKFTLRNDRHFLADRANMQTHGLEGSSH